MTELSVEPELIRWSERFAARTRSNVGAEIAQILALAARTDVISFAGGIPDPVTFPGRELAAILAELAEQADVTAFQYGPTEGLASTREWLAQVTPAQLGELLPGLQLLEERAAILNEVGTTLVERWDGRFANAVEPVTTAQEYLALLTREFPRFDDEPFYKLAQLSAWILHIEGAKRWPDVDSLTAFADYIVPAGLRAMGIVHYSEPLAAAVDSWTPIEAGSSWEVEIRAATVWACHLLAEATSALRPPELRVIDAQIDARFWLFFHKTHAPHHLTNTIYY